MGSPARRPGRGHRPLGQGPSRSRGGQRWLAGPRPSRACESSRSTAARPFSCPSPRHCNHTHMAVLIASRLRKEIAGDALFDGVSFKVERRDRLALAGPNGAGKTTLLRMLMGETRLDGGELAFEKGTRVALHDQRPPLERGLTLREYVLEGARDLVAAEVGVRRPGPPLAESDHGARAPTADAPP